MSLIFQDPTNAQSKFLLESLIEAGEASQQGGGLFAFASSRGLKLLFEDPVFKSFTDSNRFDLVIGVDAVTDLSALETAAAIAAGSNGLEVQVFMHNRGGSLFHPKFSWFQGGQSGTLIVGSGNLTGGGLRGNWEAFAVENLDAEAVAETAAIWESWMQANSDSLHAVDDEQVIAKANANASARQPSAGDSEPDSEESILESDDLKIKVESLPVLVAEIPKGGTRWNQANFDLATFQEFFGATPGQQHRVILRHVSDSGSLEEIESRPSVAVVSQNYRFELGAAAGLTYPTTGRPIGVFVRIATRLFVYKLVMPGDQPHGALESFLQAHSTVPLGRMKRVRTDSDTLKAAWPTSPLWATT